MLISGNEDLRVQKTISAIKSAFEDLICTQDYEKITVKALCDKAQINKKTFYRYYDSLDDLLKETQNLIIYEYLDKISKYSLPEDLEQINREFFIFSASKGIFYEKITSSVSYSYIRNQMIQNVMDQTWYQSKWMQSLSPSKQKISLGFIQSSSLEIYRQWVQDGKRIPLEEIIAISNDLLCRGVQGFIHSAKKGK